MQNMMTVKDASVWASKLLGKNVTPSNITYLIQYGRIPKIENNGALLVNKRDLERYYNANHGTKEKLWKKQLGNDLNWKLSFSEYKESETTKHVHRLHPYKGKFIPQLVEYFLDQHTDDFKHKAIFKAGSIVLDPFCGSGTTLVQASELNLHAIGVDISAFNSFISNAKVGQYDIHHISKLSDEITRALIEFQRTRNNIAFEVNLLERLKIFNTQFFPSPDFRHKVRNKQIDEKIYGQQKSEEFLKTYTDLVRKYNISLKQNRSESFLDVWFLQVVRDEINFVFNQVQSVENQATKKMLALILSRTMRSCRATTHADLGTLKEPTTVAYYCKKHGKICKPLFSILSWWERYTKDTIKRIQQFDRLRTNTFQTCLVGNSRTIDIVNELENKNPNFGKLTGKNKIDGIFSSPPYVGLIDYHEQHAYAYDLLGFERNDNLEIGPLCKGQGIEARKAYIEGISDVLKNCKKSFKQNYDVLLVANDKYGLYPQIAELAQMKIVNEYKRPVLNRVEKDRSAYAEIIFHMKEK
ncbi:DNA methyltransferase [Candidatus Spongiihabitans sp.]|uniref:DNA methyltransferase n=1 Tax=Candidatus Spongiihabitans sp. TaxID=3101308 RepID=UPI003C7E6DCF